MIDRLVVEPDFVNVFQQESRAKVAERKELQDPEDGVCDLLSLS